MARTTKTDMNNEMNEIATSGFDMGFYPSFLDEDRKKFGFENEDSFGFNEEHACHGLFTELGFSEGKFDISSFLFEAGLTTAP